MATQTLDQWSTKPLYQQLVETLERKIREGEWQEGTLIPSERELCDQYAVSSTTVRRALQELVNSGLVRRRAGIGSFVSSDTRNLSVLLLILGFDETDWRKHGYYFSDLMGGIAKVTWERQAVFSVAHVPKAVQDINSYMYSMIEERMFDGILIRIASDLSADHLVPFQETNFPYVAIKRSLPEKTINCVIVDDVQGGFMATEHLIRLGHRRIGMIVTHNLALGRDRSKGYFRALDTYGITPDYSLIMTTGDFLEESGYRAAQQLLAQENRPSALFVCSDIMAFGVYRAIEEAGLRIPDDIAVVGYDDIPDAARLTPPLTTISTPYHDFGTHSTSLLLDLITRKVKAPQQMVIPHSLVVRTSCGTKLSATSSTTQPQEHSIAQNGEKGNTKAGLVQDG